MSRTARLSNSSPPPSSTTEDTHLTDDGHIQTDSTPPKNLTGLEPTEEHIKAMTRHALSLAWDAVGGEARRRAEEAEGEVEAQQWWDVMFAAQDKAISVLPNVEEVVKDIYRRALGAQYGNDTDIEFSTVAGGGDCLLHLTLVGRRAKVRMIWTLRRSVELYDDEGYARSGDEEVARCRGLRPLARRLTLLTETHRILTELEQDELREHHGDEQVFEDSLVHLFAN